jgi:hypothetical protein
MFESNYALCEPGEWLTNVILSIGLVLFFGFIIWVSCASVDEYTQDPRAASVLRLAGYSNIELQDSNLFMCPGDGEVATPFTADKNGHMTSGVVCYSYRSGHTIRIN